MSVYFNDFLRPVPCFDWSPILAAGRRHEDNAERERRISIYRQRNAEIEGAARLLGVANVNASIFDVPAFADEDFEFDDDEVTHEVRNGIY